MFKFTPRDLKFGHNIIKIFSKNKLIEILLLISYQLWIHISIVFTNSKQELSFLKWFRAKFKIRNANLIFIACRKLFIVIYFYLLNIENQQQISRKLKDSQDECMMIISAVTHSSLLFPDLRPKGRGRPQRILLGIWPDEHIRGVIRAVVFRDSHHIKEDQQIHYPRIHVSWTHSWTLGLVFRH